MFDWVQEFRRSDVKVRRRREQSEIGVAGEGGSVLHDEGIGGGGGGDRKSVGGRE